MQPEKSSTTPNKKILLIVIGVILLFGIIVVVFILSSGNEENDKTQNSEETTNIQENNTNEDSDLVGMSGSCTPVNEHQWYRSDSTLTLDPEDPNILNVFIEKRGFFRSEDGGETWEYKSKGIKGFNAPDLHKGRPCYLEFRASVIDPTNPNRILIGALGDFDKIETSLNQAGGLLETLDGGENWHQILNNDVNAYVHDIAIDPTDPETIYYITSSQKPQNRSESLMSIGLAYKTTDNGKNWKELNTGILPNTGAQNIHINPQNPNELIITSSTFAFNPDGTRAPSTDTLGILKTKDGGESWQSIKSLPADDNTVLESFISPTNFNNLYIPVMSDTGARSYYSVDGGISFKKSGFPMDIVAYDPTDSTGNKMIGYSWQSGNKNLYRSFDAGATWQPFGSLPIEINNIQDPKLRIQKIIIDDSKPNNLYMAGASAFVWKSIDGGLNWKTILSLDTLP